MIWIMQTFSIKKMIDISETFEDLPTALEAIGKKSFISGNLKLVNNNLQEPISNYVRS